jgi:heterodisulfide reductase subunit C
MADVSFRRGVTGDIFVDADGAAHNWSELMSPSTPLSPADNLPAGAQTDAAGPVPAAPARTSLRAEIRERTGIDVAKCYQCGKCSAGCPMADETTWRPHDIMRLVQRNKREQALASDGLWMCLTCETCTARCPNSVDPARVIDALREIALLENPDVAPRAIRAFHQSFLDQIKLNGRMFEVGLVMEYKARSGKLLQDVLTAPGLMTRGKFHVKPNRIKNVDEVRRIFKNVEAIEVKTIQEDER